MSQKVKPGFSVPVSAGLVGWDDLIVGGFGANRTTMLVGGHGTGKTILALQTLVARARGGDPGIFVSFEESPSQIHAKALQFGWDLSELERRHLLLLHARVRPQLADTGRFALRTLLSDLGAAASQHGTRVIAFDGLHVMLASLEEKESLPCDIVRLRDWITEQRFSVIVTIHPESLAEAGFIEGIADCLVSLECTGSAGRLRRYLKLLKYRGADEKKRCWFRISARGIEVTPPRRKIEKSKIVIPQPIVDTVAKARKQLSSRLRSADAYLEAKQAEMDFLLEKKASAYGGEHEPPGKTGNLATGREPADKDHSQD